MSTTNCRPSIADDSASVYLLLRVGGHYYRINCATSLRTWPKTISHQHLSASINPRAKPKLQDQNKRDLVSGPANQAIVADSVAPRPAKAAAVQYLPTASGVRAAFKALR